jgi:hypothetical protein
MYKDEFRDLIIKGLKEAVPAVLKEYDDEDVYIMSLEADNTAGFDGEYDMTLYVNTEKRHANNLKDSEDGTDPWYFRFCECEWYIIPDPEYFEDAVNFLNDGYANMNMDTVYECIVEAVEKLREEKFFESVCPHDVFFTINASEVFGQEDMCEFAVRMNGREKSKDYIENADAFL